MRMPAAHIKNGKIRYSPQYRTICQLICLFDNVYFRFLDCGFQFVANRVRHIRHCKKRLTLQCRLKTGFRRHLRSVRKVAPAARTSRRSLCITAHLFFQIFQVQRKIRQSVPLFLFADNPPAIQIPRLLRMIGLHIRRYAIRFQCYRRRLCNKKISVFQIIFETLAFFSIVETPIDFLRQTVRIIADHKTVRLHPPGHQFPHILIKHIIARVRRNPVALFAEVPNLLLVIRDIPVFRQIYLAI